MHITEQSLLVALLAIISILVVGVLVSAVLLLLWVRRFISKIQTLKTVVADVPGAVSHYGKRAGVISVLRLLVKLI